MSRTPTPIRSVAALRELADRLEALPTDSGRIRALNNILSSVPGGDDADRIEFLLLLCDGAVEQ